MTLWQNSTTGPGQQFWKDAIAAFEKDNPNVTIKMQSIQNEDMDGKLQTSLNAGDPPDIFLQRGGGKMAAMVQAGQLMDLTGKITGEAKDNISEGSFKAETYQDKVWAMPLSVLPGGIFYSKDLYDAAGVTDDPDDDRRPRGRQRQAEGVRRGSARARREGRLARRALVLLVRAPRVRARHDGEDGRLEGLQRPVLAQGGAGPCGLRRDGAVQRRLPHHRRPSRARAARQASSPTTRRAASSWARGIRV